MKGFRSNCARDRKPLASGFSDRGFTLLELMVVIVLMATIAMIAIPRFKSLFEVNLKSSMRQLAGTIKFCFNEAIIKQSTIRLNFDVETGMYYHSTLITSADSSLGEFVPMPSSVSEQKTLPDGVFFEDIITPRSYEKEEDEAYIMFYPTGYAEKAVIHIKDADENQYTLLVKPLTGGVKIFEGYIDFAVFNSQEGTYGSSSSPFSQ